MKFLQLEKLRYLIAGGWNTFFGYSVNLCLYNFFSSALHLLVIGFIGGILSISMSFFTYKLFVFRTQGNWFVEYVRCYAVYGGATLLSIGILWGLVDYLGQPFWMAQAIAIVVTVIVSYLGHSRFTFRVRPKSKQG